MKKVNLICIIVLVLLACSNREHVETEYFDSGEVRMKRFYPNRRDTTSFFQQVFFQNGLMERGGRYVNGKRNGIWKGWFEDGHLAWIVEYENGIVKPPVKNFNWRFVIVGNHDGWYVGEPTRLRLFVEGVEPHRKSIQATQKIEPTSNRNYYYWSITPHRAGNFFIQAIIEIEDELFHILGSDSIYVHPARSQPLSFPLY